MEDTSDFAPNCLNVSTDDVDYPQETIGLTILVAFAVAVAIFIWPFRTVSNIFISDYVNKKKESEAGKEDTKKTIFHCTTTSQLAWTLLMLLLVIASPCIIWTFYASWLEAPGGVLRWYYPRDYTALAITSATSLLLFVWLILAMCVWWDMRNAKWDVQKTIMTLNGQYVYMGMNGNARASYRFIIMLFNALIWGAIPVMLSVQLNQYITSTQWGFMLTTGILCSLTWYMHNAYIVRELMTYYLNVGNFGKPATSLRPKDIMPVNAPADPNPENASPKVYRVGFDTDILGPSLFFKGLIPVQYVPELHLVARVAFFFALGFCVYNDHKQAMMLGLTAFLALVLCCVGRSSQYYIAYETSLMWALYLASYGIQIIKPSCKSHLLEYNYCMLTLQQSEAIPDDDPQTTFGSDIALALFAAFGLNVAAFVKTWSSNPISPISFEKNSD